MSDELKFRIVMAIFFVGIVLHMGSLRGMAAQSTDALKEKISDTREQVVKNSSEITALQARVDRLTADQQATIAAMANLTSQMERANGIGIALVSLGGVIALLQTIKAIIIGADKFKAMRTKAAVQ